MEFALLIFLCVVSGAGCDAMVSLVPVSDGKGYDLRNDVRAVFIGVHASILFFGSIVLGVMA